MKLFELFATLSLDTREFERNMRNATRQGSGFAGTMERQLTAGTVALGNLAADAAKSVAGAVTGIIRDAFSLTGELEQNIGGAEAVFKDFSDNIQANAQTAYKTAGLSVSDYLAEANKMGSLMQGMGFTVGESFDMSVQWMQRAADVASIMGIDVSSAMQAIEGAAKGNFTMMDNLGVAMNDTALKAYALENGLIKTDKEWAKIGQQQKIAAAFAMFMDKTSEYAGSYAKENDTLAGSMTTLSAAWENLLSGAGDPEAFSNAIENAAIVGFDTLKKLVPRLWESFKQVASKLYPKVKKALHDFWNNDAPEIAKRGANAVIDGVNAIFGTNIPHIDKIDLPTVEEISSIVKGWWNTGGRSAVESACSWVLNIFGVPTETASEVASTVGSWWDGCVSAVEAGCEWSLKFFGVKPWTDADTQKIKDWWIGASEKVEGAIDWVIHARPQDYAELANYILNEWFPNLLKKIGTLVIPIATTIIKPIIPAVEKLAGLKPGTFDAGKQMMMDTAGSVTDQNTWNKMMNAPSLSEVFKKMNENNTNNRGVGKGFATGLDYVPYNDYVARLHEGEAVLTKAEASLWRRGDDAGGAVGIDYGQLGQAVAAALSGMSVQMDGQAVGVLVTGAVSREMGRRVKARQYTG